MPFTTGRRCVGNPTLDGHNDPLSPSRTAVLPLTGVSSAVARLTDMKLPEHADEADSMSRLTS